jgi:hypothetical protein
MIFRTRCKKIHKHHHSPLESEQLRLIGSGLVCMYNVKGISSAVSNDPKRQSPAHKKQ